MKTGGDIDVEAVRQALAARGFEAVEVFNPPPTCRCVAQWKTSEDQTVALKITWPWGSPLATPKNIAGLFKHYAYRALAVTTAHTRWVGPEATIFLCKQLLEEIP